MQQEPHFDHSLHVERNPAPWRLHSKCISGHLGQKTDQLGVCGNAERLADVLRDVFEQKRSSKHKALFLKH